MDTNSTITGRTTTNSISSVRYMSVTAMLSAVAFILMFLDFSVPFMPAFIKMDLSELPALIGAFSMGPVCGHSDLSDQECASSVYYNNRAASVSFPTSFWA